MQRDVYTIPQLAERWQCSRDVIYDLVRTDQLKCFRVGTAIRFTAESVYEYENN